MGYLTEEAAEAVKRYKYSGGDHSLVYQYVLTPMNKWLIEFFPKWIAPNVITCIGLAFSVSANILTWLYSPDFGQQVPAWVCFYVTFTLFAYQTLDNLDGRQARRTGSSSPLGMLFDHGIDAINITVASMALFAVVQPGTTIDLFMLWFEGVFPFFFCTWEEYYVGTLTLPIVNGPTEGILLTMSFAFMQGAGVVDFAAPVIANFPSLAHFSSLEFMLQWPTVRLIVLAGILTAPPTCLYHVYGAFTAQYRKKGLAGVVDAIYKLTPFLAYTATSSLWSYYSPAHIFQQHTRLFMLAHCFIFCVLATEVMLAHITEQEFRPTSSLRVLLPQLFAFAAGAFPIIDEPTALLLLFIWSFGTWFHMAHGIVTEMTTILNIRCFSIKPVEKVKGDKQVYGVASSPSPSPSHAASGRSVSSPSAPVIANGGEKNGHSANGNGFLVNGHSTTRERKSSQNKR